MIKVQFTFFQLQQEGIFKYAGKLVRVAFGEALQRFYTANVGRVLHELVRGHATSGSIS